MSARRTAIVACMALAEAAVMSPLLSLFVPLPVRSITGGTLAVLWVLLLGLGMQWRALAHYDLSLRLQRVVMGAWLIALVVAAEIQSFASLPEPTPDVLTMLPGFVGALLVWWRGMALGKSDLHPRAAELHLQVGILLFVVIGVATLFTQNVEVMIYIVAFFFGALLSIPLSNLELTHASPIGRPVRMRPSWWAWLLGVVCAVLAAGLLLTSLMTGQSVVALIGLLLGILLLPAVLLAALIPESFFEWLRALLERVALLFRDLRPPAEDAAVQPQAEATSLVPTVPPAVGFVITLLIFAALVILILMLMRRSERRALIANRQAADDEGALARAGDALGGRATRTSGLAALRRWLATLTIRRLYARATHEAGRRGFRRAAAQTPYDFLPVLQRAFPAAESEARVITDAYVAAHYGEVPDTQEALEALKAAWERMRTTRPDESVRSL